MYTSKDNLTPLLYSGKIKKKKNSFSCDENFFFVFLPFLGLLLRPIEVPRLGVQSEL